MSYAPRSYQNSRNNRGRSNEKGSFYTEDESCNVLRQNDGNFHYSKEETNNGQEKQVFFQSDVGNEVEDILLVGETVNKAVLDSGASKTAVMHAGSFFANRQRRAQNGPAWRRGT